MNSYFLIKKLQWSEETATVTAAFKVTTLEQGLKDYALRLNFTKVGGVGSLISEKTLLVVQSKNSYQVLKKNDHELIFIIALKFVSPFMIKIINNP